MGVACPLPAEDMPLIRQKTTVVKYIPPSAITADL
jgi:hypothetical protein